MVKISTKSSIDSCVVKGFVSLFIIASVCCVLFVQAPSCAKIIVMNCFVLDSFCARIVVICNRNGSQINIV